MNENPVAMDTREVVVSPSWIRFIRFCKTKVPNGDIKIKIVNGEPTRLLEKKEDIRFDKEIDYESWE